MGMRWSPSEQKLIADLEPKENIVVHQLKYLEAKFNILFELHL
jgi:hypothetical protein